MEMSGLFETLILIYKATRCHIPGNRNLDALHRENLKSTAFFTFTYLKSHIISTLC
jgi:hypothetical protein